MLGGNTFLIVIIITIIITIIIRAKGTTTGKYWVIDPIENNITKNFYETKFIEIEPMKVLSVLKYINVLIPQQ